jgi:hypothetical protein
VIHELVSGSLRQVGIERFAAAAHGCVSHWPSLARSHLKARRKRGAGEIARASGRNPRPPATHGVGFDGRKPVNRGLRLRSGAL